MADLQKNNDKLTGADPKKRRNRIVLIAVIAVLAVIGMSVRLLDHYMAQYDGDDPAWVYIPRGATAEAVADSLVAALGPGFGRHVALIYSGDPAAAEGAYLINPGDRGWRVARRLSKGRQTPVKVTFNNIRTLDQLAGRLGERMEFTDYEFLRACDSVIEARGIARDTFPTMLLPDTYEAYWDESPARLLGRFEASYNRFWSAERRSKAAALGLTPAKVTILASIAEEESAVPSERGKIARLYINRLNRGMRLQADPTVKFASGEFTARRITGAMLASASPYNTYRVTGLPPGPIRIASAETIDAVLNSEPHNFIYMCASPDFSGTHLFAADFATHQANAAAYHRALDSRGITR